MRSAMVTWDLGCCVVGIAECCHLGQVAWCGAWRVLGCLCLARPVRVESELSTGVLCTSCAPQEGVLVCCRCRQPARLFPAQPTAMHAPMCMHARARARARARAVHDEPPRRTPPPPGGGSTVSARVLPWGRCPTARGRRRRGAVRSGDERQRRASGEVQGRVRGCTQDTHAPCGCSRELRGGGAGRALCLGLRMPSPRPVVGADSHAELCTPATARPEQSPSVVLAIFLNASSHSIARACHGAARANERPSAAVDRRGRCARQERDRA